MAFGHEKPDVYRAAIECVGWTYCLCEWLEGHIETPRSRCSVRRKPFPEHCGGQRQGDRGRPSPILRNRPRIGSRMRCREGRAGSVRCTLSGWEHGGQTSLGPDRRHADGTWAARLFVAGGRRRIWHGIRRYRYRAIAQEGNADQRAHKVISATASPTNSAEGGAT